MITTVTMNPAVDKTVTIEGFAIGAVNRIVSSRVDAGGKGINVSKVICQLGGKSRAAGFLAGQAGRFIKEYLDQQGIENRFHFIPGETRTNLKVVDTSGKTNTDINEPGPELAAAAREGLQEDLLNTMGAEDILVLSGSVPANVEKTVYREWIEAARQRDIKTLLDADGELLRQGLEAGPYLVKPNIHELENLLGCNLATTEEVLAAADKLRALHKIENVVVSLGSEGALFVGPRVLLAEGIKVPVKSTVGAGDAMVGALAFALDQAYSFEQAAILAVAAGTAAVTMDGTQASDLRLIRSYAEQVKWKEIKREK